jgi:hypothetical protein
MSRGLKPRTGGSLNVRDKSRTYLRSNDEDLSQKQEQREQNDSQDGCAVPEGTIRDAWIVEGIKVRCRWMG